MPSPLIRAPRPDDAAALADLHLRTWEETYAGLFPPSAWDEDARQQRLVMWQAICAAPRPGRRTAVAERDGAPVGFARTGPTRDEDAPRAQQVQFIYLLAAEQRSGAGQALLDAVLGDDPASLWVLEAIPRARAFYARNGFAADGARQPSGFPAAGDEIRMVR